MMLYTVAVIVVLLFALATQMFKVLREYERGVVFFLGRFQEVKGPGLIILIPFIQQWCVLIYELLCWMCQHKI